MLAPLVLALLAPAQDPKEITLDRDDLEISESVVVRPGAYRIEDRNSNGVVRIVKSGITVDFGGARLVGCADGSAADGFEGIGIVVEGQHDVTIRSARLSGFRVGIQARGCANLRIEGCEVGGMRRMRLRSTPEREDGADWLWPHENDEGEWARKYGAGIWAKECAESWFVGNRARASQNGLLLDRCEGCRVHDNDLSFLSGWGLAMWRSSSNEVAHNRFDWCVRGYSHGVYDRGQDSAGILVFEQCSDNVFAYNSATHGGDGFFLYAGHETLERTGVGGCNRNLLYRNDFSHAVANGIEATFSEKNVFAENVLDDCSQHGVWGGFSYGTTIVMNRIAKAGGGGISIEHGHDNWIEGNEITSCRAGIELWENESTPFRDKPYGKKQETRSLRASILRNVLRGNELAIDLRRTGDATIRWNVFDDNRVALRLAGAAPGLVFADNVFRVGRELPEAFVRNETTDEIALGRNAWGTPDVAKLVGPRAKPGANLAPTPTIDPKESGRKAAPPKVGGSLDAFLPKDARRGREFILVDEWGPYDFSSPRVWPSQAYGWGEVAFTVLGPPGRCEVSGLPAGVVARAKGAASAGAGASGGFDVPGGFVVRFEDPARMGVVPFEVAVKIGAETLRARGVLSRADWNVSFYRWDPSSQDPRASKDHWNSILASPPVDAITTERIDFAWGGGAPTPKTPADHFATVAETTLELPAGEYDLATVSDDGVRVLVDGKVAQEDWTWHPPKENRATLRLEAGPHRFRVEHFEIDGFAALSLRLEPR